MSKEKKTPGTAFVNRLNALGVYTETVKIAYNCSEEKAKQTTIEYFGKNIRGEVYHTNKHGEKERVANIQRKAELIAEKFADVVAEKIPGFSLNEVKRGKSGMRDKTLEKIRESENELENLL